MHFRFYLFLIGFFISFQISAELLRFAPLPMLDERSLRQRFSPMLQFIEQHTSETINWQYYPEYDQILDHLKSGSIDMAFLGPLPYIVLSEEDRDMELLARFKEQDGSHDYQCALATFGGENKLDEKIKNKHFALTQPLSTCGYFSVALMLQRSDNALNQQGNRFSFTGGHDKAALAVIAGEADFAGLKLSIAKKYKSLNLRVVDQIGPYPGFVLIGNKKTLSEQRIAALKKALSDFSHQKPLDQWPPQGLLPAVAEDYRSLREGWQSIRQEMELLD